MAITHQPMVLVTSLFFLWGLANNLNDILVKQFTKAFDLSDFRAGLVMTAVNFGYFVAALPAGFLTKRHSYKRTILIGLALYSCGALLFVPASMWRTYPLFLFSLLVIGCGLACLETAANPFVSVLGPAESSTRRLNFAQAFNPLGSIAGVVIGRNFIFDGRERDLRSCSRVCEELRASTATSREVGAVSLACSTSLDTCNTSRIDARNYLGCWLQSESKSVWPSFTPICSLSEVSAFEEHAALAVQRPYLLIAVTVGLVALFVVVTPFPSPAPCGSSANTGNTMGATGDGVLLPTLRRLACQVGWREGAAAQFLYVGAQIGVWSFIIRYVQHNLPGTSEQDAADYLFASLVCMVLGRFASVGVLRWAAGSGQSGPRSSLTGVQLMEAYAWCNCLLCFVAVTVGGPAGSIALVAVSFFMSIMYPTIFTTAIAGLGEDTEIASGVIVSCIVGGAIVTPVMGAVSDFAGSIRIAYLVPIMCFAGVGVYSHRASSRESLDARARTQGQPPEASSSALKAAILSEGAP